MKSQKMKEIKAFVEVETGVPKGCHKAVQTPRYQRECRVGGPINVIQAVHHALSIPQASGLGYLHSSVQNKSLFICLNACMRPGRQGLREADTLPDSKSFY